MYEYVGGSAGSVAVLNVQRQRKLSPRTPWRDALESDRRRDSSFGDWRSSDDLADLEASSRRYLLKLRHEERLVALADAL